MQSIWGEGESQWQNQSWHMLELSAFPCLVSEGEGMEELREVGEVGVLESLSDCGQYPRVIPLALSVHRVSLHVHQFTCTCVSFHHS